MWRWFDHEGGHLRCPATSGSAMELLKVWRFLYANLPNIPYLHQSQWQAGARDTGSLGRTDAEPCTIGGSVTTSLGRAKICAARELLSVLQGFPWGESSWRSSWLLLWSLIEAQDHEGERGWLDEKRGKSLEKNRRGLRYWASRRGSYSSLSIVEDAVPPVRHDSLSSETTLCEGRCGNLAAWDADRIRDSTGWKLRRGLSSTMRGVLGDRRSGGLWSVKGRRWTADGLPAFEYI